MDKEFYRKPFQRFRCFSSSGDPMHIEYQAQYDKNGNMYLKETGKVNTYLDIQSHAASCDINVLVARYKAGEIDVLDRVQGYYGDFTDIPDIHRIYNMLKSAEQDFAKLPTEVKQRFENNFEKYLFSVGSEDWIRKMEILPQDGQNDIIKDEVIKDGE